MIATTQQTELIDWTSPEVLGAWSTDGANRAFARCPFEYGTAKWHRWWVAREESLGIQRGRHVTNAREIELKVVHFNYDTDKRESA